MRVTSLLRLFRHLEGPQTVGRGPAFWITFAVVFVIACAYPLVSDGYTVGNTVYFFIWVFIALSLCLIWGYGGALSFGQTAFFGIAGYGYGILTINFGKEIDSPESKAFFAKFKAKFPNEPYVNQEAENSYLAVYLYKQMVERAKSTKREEIRKVIAQGDVCLDAPEGKVCIDPKSQHMSHTIYLAKVGADHSISFPKVWKDIKPYWLGEAGCDLTKKDPMAQYTPSNPPPKP